MNFNKYRKKYRPELTGDDIDMLREKEERNRHKKDLPIADYHEDAA